MMPRILVAQRRASFHGRAAVTVISIACAFVLAGEASAQIIAVRSRPIADGDQFSFFPSANFGMGGVSIALPDTLHDPFVNPATGARLRGSYFFGAPTSFSVSRKAGGGTTLPVGVVARSGTSFAGLAVAIQSIDAGRRRDVINTPGFLSSVAGDVETGDSHTNRYGFAMLGRSFPTAKLSVAASAFVSGLGAIDGVDVLYFDSRSVDQSGGTVDFRLGLLKEWNGGGSLEALVVHNRVGMSHVVTYDDFLWDPLQRQLITRPRIVRNRERATTSGIHLEYQRPLPDSGWRAGVLLTANRIAHPSAADYEISSVPGDGGRATAFNLGVGLARSLGNTSFGIDAIYEPITSETWTLADSIIDTPARGTIDTGGRMVENRFRFSNTLLRAGLSHELALAKRETALRLQAGLQARSIYYQLDQQDLVSRSTRTADDGWLEWTSSWGTVLRLGSIELHYRGRITTGVERPGGVSEGTFPGVLADVAISRFPGPVATSTTMSGVRVATHQFSISLPIR